MGAACDDVDVLLDAVSIGEVQVIAAFCGLQVDINTLGVVGLGCTVEAAHHAGEVVSFVLGGLIQTQLVGHADLGRGGVSAEGGSGGVRSLANVAAGLAGKDELSHELSLANSGSVSVGDVVGAGGGDGVEIVVSTQEVLGAAQFHSVDLSGGVVSPVDAGRSDQCGTCAELAFLVGVAFQLQVSLGLAAHEVEADALAFGLLNEQLHGVVDVLGGSQVAAVLLTVEVQNLAQGDLLHLQDVGGLSLQGTQVDGSHTAAHGPAVQSTTGTKFQLAVVVLDDTGDGDRIGDADLVSAVALQAVALDLLAVDLNGDGHVAVAGIVSLIHSDDLTGQGCTVRQLLAGSQLVSVIQDLDRIGGGTLCHAATADAVQQLTAGVELDLALVVLDDTGNGDLVVDSDLAHINALQTEGDDGVVAVAIGNHDNGDVAIVGIIGGVNTGDSTGHGDRIRQSLAVGQVIGSLQDGANVGGSLDSVTLLNGIQSTAGVELDLAVVVLQRTGDGDDVADSQIFSAFALQTVALDGHVLNALNGDGNGDVLILSAVNSVDGDDLTAQGGFIGQSLAGGQLVSGLDNLGHVCSSRQDHVPGVRCGAAELISDGSGQGVGSCDITGFVHVDGDRAIFVDDDLDQVFAHVDSPNDSEGNTCDTDDAVTVIVDGGGSGLCGVLVDSAQVSHSFLSGGTLRCSRLIICGLLYISRGVGGGSIRLIDRLLTAGQHAQKHDEQEYPC